MNEPKKRGRPSKAEIAARIRETAPVEPSAEAVLKDALADQKELSEAQVLANDAGMLAFIASSKALKSNMEAQALGSSLPPEHAVETERWNAAADAAISIASAQAYALRIWAGQTAEMKRDERIRRCEAALQGQNLPTEGVRYPGGESSEVAVKFDPKADQSPAQVLAMKIWAGQSTDVHRHERIARIGRALQEQGLSTGGIMYPASIDRINVDDDEPVFWRMKMPGTEGIV